MRAADYLVDVGPGAGVHGGEIVAAGTLEDIMQLPSLHHRPVSVRQEVHSRPGAAPRGQWALAAGLRLPGKQPEKRGRVHPAGHLHLHHRRVRARASPVWSTRFSTRSWPPRRNHARTRPGKHDHFEGLEYIDKVIGIDQSPIGRTPRSNPATYTGLFGDIRELFASTQDAKIRGYTSGRFSFNIRGGRCEACQGDGLVKIEMHFLPDVYVPCEVCHGRRYNRETLEVLYKGKSIYDVLEMTADEALPFFESLPKLRSRIQTLVDVGLGYVKLGQAATTLSGGEAQRVKLATELSRRSTGSTVYFLDEPTTGLHMADVHKLIEVLQMLVDAGNTVIVIEHNLDVIKVADHIIDLGPDGGDAGGQIVATGTPEDIAACPESATGQFLKRLL